MSSDVLAKAQDFSKGMSYMQASNQATWRLNLLSVGMASGSSQAMLPCGYASSAGYGFKEGFPAAVYGLAVSDLPHLPRLARSKCLKGRIPPQQRLPASRPYGGPTN